MLHIQKWNVSPRWRARLRSGALSAVGIVVLGAAVAACGGAASTPGVASGSATITSAVRSTAAGAGQAAGLFAYSSRMRAHGVPNFPDPSSSGGINDKWAVVQALEGVSNSRDTAAQNTCQHLIPKGGLGGQAGQPPKTAQQIEYEVAFARCVREHGISNFPDPDGQGEFNLAGAGINQNDLTPTQLDVARTCLPASHGTIRIPPQATNAGNAAQ